MVKVVLKLELFDDKSKKKAMKAVSGHTGVESVSLDMKEKKLTVIGDIDPVAVVAKLRKLCLTDIVTVGPAKEPEKKKEEPKKEEPKKKDEKDDAAMKAQQAYYYYYQQALPHYQYPTTVPPYYHHRGVEENPNACLTS